MMGLLSLVLAMGMIGVIACGSDSEPEAPLTAVQIALATAQAAPDSQGSSQAPTGAGDLSAAHVLQRSGEVSATLESFRFTTETVVTAGETAQIAKITGEWSLPGRYRAFSDNSEDLVEEFIVGDGQLIYRERGTDVWQVETEFDQALGIGSGQLIPGMDIFEFSDPLAPDDGEFYNITGAENIEIEGVDVQIVQTHELRIRVSDFHVDTVVSFINPNPEIGLEGTRRVFKVFDRNGPEPILLPEVILPVGG